jgi:putative transposase
MGLRNRTKLLDYNCFFVTTTCHNFLPLLANEHSKQVLYDSIAFVNAKYKCRIIAYVFMPDHIHFVCFFEEQNFLIEYMRDFKKFTAFRLRKYVCEEGPDWLKQAITYNTGSRNLKYGRTVSMTCISLIPKLYWLR